MSSFGSEGRRLARNTAFLSAAQLISLLLGLVTLFWTGLGCPPPGLVVAHGFPPAGGPVTLSRLGSCLLIASPYSCYINSPTAIMES